MAGRRISTCPLQLLGLTGSSGLGLLAFAVEEPAPETGLQIWATAPAFNSANSPRANPLVAHVPAGSTFALSHLYRWPHLGDGICPNGSDGSQPGAYFADTNPQITFSTNPPGGAVVGVGGGAFWLGEPQAVEEEILRLMQAAYPAIADGQEILYTISYRNRGNADGTGRAHRAQPTRGDPPAGHKHRPGRYSTGGRGNSHLPRRRRSLPGQHSLAGRVWPGL